MRSLLSRDLQSSRGGARQTHDIIPASGKGCEGPRTGGAGGAWAPSAGVKAPRPRKQPVKALTLLGDGVQNTGRKSGGGCQGWGQGDAQ